MNIQEFAQGIRDYDPTLYGGAAWADDDKLVNHWIKEVNPDDAKFLDLMPSVDSFGNSYAHEDDSKFTSHKRPAEAGGRITGALQDTWFNMKELVAGIPAATMNQINTLINPYERRKSVVADIQKYEDILANPSEYPQEWFPGKFIDRTESGLEMTRKKLESSKKFLGILDDVIERDRSEQSLDGHELKRRVQGLDNEDVYGNRFQHYMTTTVQEILFQAYKGGPGHMGTLEATIGIREKMDDVVRQWIENDTRIQASKKWREDVPFDSLDDFFSPDMLARGMADLGASLAVMWAGGSIAAIPKVLSTAGKWNKVQAVMNSMGGPGAMGTMYLMEGGEAQEQVLRYLTEEYEWTGPDGQAMKGIPIEDALPVAGYVTTIVGATNMWLEKLQLDKVSKFLDPLQKGSTKSLVRTITDKTMKKYAPEFVPGMLTNFTQALVDVPINAWEQGLVEGYQATVTHLATEAANQGYEVNNPTGFSELLYAAGVEADKAGIHGLWNPYTSDIDDVRISAWTGSAGFFGSGTVNLPLKGVNYLRGGKEEQLFNDLEEHVKRGGNANFNWDRKTNIITITNLDTGAKNVIQADNADEAQAIQEQFQLSVNFGEVKTNLNIELPTQTARDYIDILINQSGKGTVKLSNTDIVRENMLPSQGNIIQELIRKHSTSRGGKEASLGEKIVDLFNQTDEAGNQVFTLGMLNNLKNEYKDDPAKLMGLSVIEVAAAKAIKSKVIKNITNKVQDGLDDVSERNIESHVNNTLEVPNSKIIEKYLQTFKDDKGKTHRALELEISGNILKDESNNISFGDRADSAIEEWINGDLENISLNDNQIDSEIDANVERQIDDHQAREHDLKLKKILAFKPVKNINDTEADSNSLYATLAQRFMGVEPGTNPMDAVVSFITGRDGNTPMYATNLAKILKKLKIDYDPKDIGTGKGRLKYAKQVANAIKEDIIPDHSRQKKIKKKPKKTIIKPITAKPTKLDTFKSGIISLYNQRAKAKSDKELSAIDDKILDVIQTALDNKVITQDQADKSLDTLDKKVKTVKKAPPKKAPKDKSQKPTFVKVPGKGTVMMPRIEALKKLTLSLFDESRDALLEALGYKGPNRVTEALAEYESMLDKKAPEVEKVIPKPTPIETQEIKTVDSDELDISADELADIINESTENVQKEVSKQASRETAKKTASKINDDLKC